MCIVSQTQGFGGKELILPKVTEQAEKELLTALALKEPTFAEIAILIAKYEPLVESTSSLRPADIVQYVRQLSFETFLLPPKTTPNIGYGVRTARSTANTAPACQSSGMRKGKRDRWNDASLRSDTWTSSNLAWYSTKVTSNVLHHILKVQRTCFRSRTNCVWIVSWLLTSMRTSRLTKQHFPPTLSSHQVSRRHISFLSHAMTLLFA